MKGYETETIKGRVVEEPFRVQMSGIKEGDVLHVTQPSIPCYEAILHVINVRVSGTFVVSGGQISLEYGEERVTTVVQRATTAASTPIRPGTILVHSVSNIVARRLLGYNEPIIGPDTPENIVERKRACGEWA